MWPMILANSLSLLDVAEKGLRIRERHIETKLFTALTNSGLIEYDGLDLSSDPYDCGGCEFGPSCDVERLGGTDEEPEYHAHCLRGDIMIYRERFLRCWRLSVPTVLKLLMERLGMNQSPEVLIPNRLWELEKINPRVRLFLFRGVSQRDASIVTPIIAERVKLMCGIVLVPGEMPAPGIIPEQVAVLPLCEIIRQLGDVIILDHELLQLTANQLCGEKARPTIVPITTPDGFTWPQVRLEFISDEDVRIWTVGEPVIRSFTELGLVNARDQQPNRLWRLLREFAAYEGVYDPEHRSTIYPPVIQSSRANVPRLSAFSPKLTVGLSQLADHLQKLFPEISGRPFARYDARQHQYRAIIQICWEPGYRQQKASLLRR